MHWFHFPLDLIRGCWPWYYQGKVTSHQHLVTKPQSYMLKCLWQGHLPTVFHPSWMSTLGSHVNDVITYFTWKKHWGLEPTKPSHTGVLFRKNVIIFHCYPFLKNLPSINASVQESRNFITFAPGCCNLTTSSMCTGIKGRTSDDAKLCTVFNRYLHCFSINA